MNRARGFCRAGCVDFENVVGHSMEPHAVSLTVLRIAYLIVSISGQI